MREEDLLRQVIRVLRNPPADILDELVSSLGVGISEEISTEAIVQIVLSGFADIMEADIE